MTPLLTAERIDTRAVAVGVRSLPALLAEAARREPDRILFSTIDRDGTVADSATAAQLHADCRAIAARLREVAAPGDRVLVPAMPGLQFHRSFLACLYAGLVAVPVPPIRAGGLRQLKVEKRVNRLLTVCADCSPVAALVPADQAELLAALAADVPELADVHFVAATPLAGPPAESPDSATAEPAELVDPDSLAFLQYTSGSTSAPRGVMISHGAMIANQRLIRDELQLRPTTAIVSWLPTYHDMGLCAGLLQPLFAGASAVLMEPETFLLRPERWLAALSGHADAATAAPDFAYALAAGRISAAAKAGWDLSGVRIALCGAEPVKADTIRTFTAAFEGTGFRPSAFTPAYGLAESTLYVCGAEPAEPAPVERYDRAALGAGFGVRSSSADGLELVQAGRPSSQVDVRVVDPETLEELPAGSIGEIWVNSASNGSGYWGQPEASLDTFGGALADRPGQSWLRTGDLGFIDNGCVVIAGRRKEMMIIRGVNYYPHDFERLAQGAHPLLTGGPAAAFTDPRRPDRVVVAVEIDRSTDPDLAFAAASDAADAIAEVLPVQVEVVLVGSARIPRTTSGKVRRLDCAQLFGADPVGLFGVLTSSHQPPAS